MIKKDDNNYPFAKRLTGARSSVHYNDTTRFDEADNQSKKEQISVDQIIKYTNDYLEQRGLKRIDHPRFENITDLPLDIDYNKIKEDYQLNSVKHIIWMKFTTSGHLGVVAASNDINFRIPENEEQYNEKGKKRWKYNTSGIIIHHLKQSWDESFVLIFPLPGITNQERSEIEQGIGNYLISKEVPILDFYSHMF